LLIVLELYLFIKIALLLLLLLLLLQVYRARLRSNGQEVAVKVQRPGALSTISKDLYVMRRGIGVYEQLVKRFTAQTTDYQQLLSTFAEGLYTEMDFRNEVRACACVCICCCLGDKEMVDRHAQMCCIL
jgi:hypothetical protein